MPSKFTQNVYYRGKYIINISFNKLKQPIYVYTTSIIYILGKPESTQAVGLTLIPFVIMSVRNIQLLMVFIGKG